MGKYTSYLSIKDWGIIFVCACIIQTALHFTYVTLKDKQRPFDPVLLSVKEQVEAQDHKVKKVLVFGSSLIGHGLACADDSVFTQSSTNQNISIFKIWGSEDPFQELFSSNKYLEQILSIKPDLICIQTELAAVNLKWLEYETNLFKNISIENRALKQLILNLELKELDIQSYCNPKLRLLKDEKDSLRIISQEREIKSYAQISDGFNTLKHLSEQNIKIVILDIPRPISLENQYKTEPYLKQLNNLLSIYKRELDVDYWPYDGKIMHYKDFVDRGHLNTSGKRYYSAWLLNTIHSKGFN